MAIMVAGECLSIVHCATFAPQKSPSWLPCASRLATVQENFKTGCKKNCLAQHSSAMHVKLPSVEQRNHPHFPGLNDLKRNRTKIYNSISPTLVVGLFARWAEEDWERSYIAALNKYNPRKLTWIRWCLFIDRPRQFQTYLLQSKLSSQLTILSTTPRVNFLWSWNKIRKMSKT